MVTLRKSGDRGRFDFGWLDTRHTFSFGEYRDPAQMGFRSLRVINEDRVKPGQGFGTHGHRDMEILTFALSGSIEHKDSEGNTGVIKPGIVQVMSAGTGIQHSEANPSATEIGHFLQIWILPGTKGIKPRYEDRAFPTEQMRNRLCLIASPDEAEGSLLIHQDARVYAAALDAGAEVTLEVAAGRGIWVQVARGDVSLGYGFNAAKGGMECAGEWSPLVAGDGAALQGERKVVVRAETAAQGAAAPSAGAEILVFDLA